MRVFKHSRDEPTRSKVARSTTAKIHRIVSALVGQDPAFVKARETAEDAITQCERTASRAQRALYEAHVAAKGAGRSSIRALHSEQRASRAEGVLEMSKTAPALTMKLLMRATALLEDLAAASPCASCKLKYGHRYNCRVEAALEKIARTIARYPRKPARHATGPVAVPNIKIVKHR